MKLYWPEATAQGANYVGYNHGIMHLQKALSEYLTDDPGKADFRVYCNIAWHHDPAFLKKEGLPVLAYTMYESTLVPMAWIKFLNEHTVGVIVPSAWCKKVFEDSGCKKPVFVVSLGVDDSEIPAYEPSNSAGRPYRFLWQGVAFDPGGRKGADIVVKAFKELRADGELDNAELILKYKPHEKFIKMDRISLPSGIVHVQEKMNSQEYNELFNSIDCCVNPTHGEGFGLIPLEQMARGKPVLVTNYSMPYIDPEVCIPLKYELKESPVVWNHMHLTINLNSVFYNFGGLSNEIKWMPKLLQHRPVSGDTEFTSTGIKIVKGLCLKNRVINIIGAVQKATGLYFHSRKSYTIFQESPGQDAFVDIDDLKKAMIWCYENRSDAEDMGFRARQHVLHYWTLDRIKSEFDSIYYDLLPLTRSKKCR